MNASYMCLKKYLCCFALKLARSVYFLLTAVQHEADSNIYTILPWRFFVQCFSSSYDLPYICWTHLHAHKSSVGYLTSSAVICICDDINYTVGVLDRKQIVDFLFLLEFI
jgi:hypothetical protein